MGRRGSQKVSCTAYPRSDVELSDPEGLRFGLFVAQKGSLVRPDQNECKISGTKRTRFQLNLPGEEITE